MLPCDGEISDIHTVDYDDDAPHLHDRGPASQQFPQTDEGENGITNSSVILPDDVVNIKEKVEDIVHDVIGNNAQVHQSKRGKLSIPWPTRDNTPLSEFSTKYFFTLAFPTLFSFGSSDYHVNRKRTCSSFSDWVEHLFWFKDGRFAQHPYFKFVAHNILMRKRALDNSSYIVNQKLGEKHLTVDDLKEKLQNEDQSIG